MGKMLYSVKELFCKISSDAIHQQKANGSMPAGCNGPHNDPETPVRNTSHWLITFLKCYKLTGQDRFKIGGEKCLEYIMHNNEARPYGFTFHHRLNSKKDACNGIMGQAWTLEALVYAAKILNGNEALDLATKVYNLIPYNKELHGWERIEINGNNIGIDSTFNHQLWYASIGCELLNLGVSHIKGDLLHFVNHIPNHLHFYRDGVVKHNSYGYGRPTSIRKAVGYVVSLVKELFKPYDSMYTHSVGYHAFNVYGLYVIQNLLSEDDLKVKSKFKKGLEVFFNKKFVEELEKARFGYAYNPPGIEAAISLQGYDFKEKNELEKEQVKWIEMQFKKTLETKHKLAMTKGTSDPLTLNARIYELYRLNSFDLKIIV